MVITSRLKPREGELSRDIFGSQIASARADAAAFEQIARQKLHVLANAISGDIGAGQQRSGDHRNSYQLSHDCAILVQQVDNPNLTHLRALEAESIHILREVAAEFQRPVMLYSIGKDSSVMVRLAQKAFYPGKIPFPLLHIDTTYKFREMIEFRDRFCAEIGAKLIVHTNRKAIEDGANPFRLGTQKCCALLKTR